MSFFRSRAVEVVPLLLLGLLMCITFTGRDRTDVYIAIALFSYCIWVDQNYDEANDDIYA